MAKQVACDCGSTYQTPHGEEDAVAFVQWHARQVHPDQFPQGVSPEDARQMVREL